MKGIEGGRKRPAGPAGLMPWERGRGEGEGCSFPNPRGVSVIFIVLYI